MYQLYALLALYIYIYIERRKIDRTNSPLISWPTFHALQLCFYRRARIPSFWRAVVLSNYPRDLEESSGGKDGLIMCCYLRPIKTKFIRFFFFLLFLFFLPRLTIPPVFFPRHSCFYLASNFFSKHGIITGEIHYCFTQLLSRIGGSIWKNIFRVISFYLSRICMGIIW